MRWSVGTKIGAGYALAVVVLSGIGLTSYWSIARLVEAAKQRSHTHVTLASLETLLSIFKDAESGQRGYLITGRESYLEPYEAAIKTIGPQTSELRRLMADNPNQQRRLDAIQALTPSKLEELKATIDLRRAKGFEAAAALVLSDKGKQAMDGIRTLVADMEKEEADLLQQRDVNVAASADRAIYTIAYGIPLAVAFLTVVAWLITRNIADPLKEVATAATRISAGDVSVKPTIRPRADEVGVLVEAFNVMTASLQGMVKVAERIAAGDIRIRVEPRSEKDLLGIAFATMIDRLREMTRDISSGVNVLASSSTEILAATTQMASSSAQTATAVSETTATVEEVKQTTQVSTQKAQYVSESAQKTAQISQTGKRSIEESIEAMHGIQAQMESIAESIVRLSEQGQAIGGIIATVTDLAEQSNLLAVNAAIEAAKAGEQGKGFAVVAQEVKSLAEQSKRATAQVRTILGDIQKATSGAVMAIEQGSKAVDGGMKLSGDVNESIRSLAESIAESAQAAIQIAASARQQLVGMDQVAIAMQNINQASAQNLASTKQAEATAKSLHDLGLRLKTVVEQYQV